MTQQETNLDVALNSADCIKSTQDFFSTTYHNICEGTQTVVETGTIEIMVNYFFTALIASFLTLLLGFVCYFIKEEVL